MATDNTGTIRGHNSGETFGGGDSARMFFRRQDVPAEKQPRLQFRSLRFTFHERVRHSRAFQHRVNLKTACFMAKLFFNAETAASATVQLHPDSYNLIVFRRMPTLLSESLLTDLRLLSADSSIYP